jgi:hypothetical protein
MKKTVALICIAITVVMALALTVVLIIGVSGNSSRLFNWGNSGVRVNFFDIGSGGRAEMLKEASIHKNDMHSLNILNCRNTIYIRATDSDFMSVRQYGPSNLHKNDIFELIQNVNGDTSQVTINGRQSARIGIFLTREYIEIDMPRSWLGNVDIRGSSGGIRIQDAFHWEDINITSASGGIAADSWLRGNSIDISVSSGGVTLRDAISADRLSMRATSGGIRTEGITANSVNLSVSSGGITIRGPVTTDDFNMRSTSGGTNAQLINAEHFNIESSSGGVRIVELNGHGTARTTSGGIRIELLNPTGNVELRASSGGIRADVPGDLRHFVSVHTTSGTVSVNDR